jgi:GNAT superfamily N-acetyltransferase
VITRDIASKSTPTELAAVVTSIYNGYFVPIIFNEAMMTKYIAQAPFDMNHSYVWYDEQGKSVAAIFLARGRDHLQYNGWIGAFGVSLPFRQFGIAQRCFNDAIQLWKHHLYSSSTPPSLNHIQLECITLNIGARKVYERAGFRLVRQLDIFTGVLRSSQWSISEMTSRVKSEPGNAFDIVLKHSTRIHSIDGSTPSNCNNNGEHKSGAIACWQHTPGFITRVPPIVVHEALVYRCNDQSEPDGFIIYSVATGVTTSPNGTAIIIVDTSSTSVNVAEALWTSLTSRYDGATFKLVNEPIGSSMHQFLSRTCPRSMSQHEMHWDPKTASSAPITHST